MTYQDPTRGPLTSGSLASKVGGRVIGRDDLPITGLETMERAGPEHLTFIRNPTFAAMWSGCKGGSALISERLLTSGELTGHDASSRALVVVPDADLALNIALEFFAPQHRPFAVGVHPAATIDPTATIGANVAVGPHAVIGADCVIGDGASIGPVCVLGRGVRIGAGTVLHPRVTIYDGCEIGRMCVLHSGVVIGADGFGYRQDPSGRGLIKVPQIGNTVIQDAVEVGANSCIDRAKFGSTIIGAGTKIDNLVQIAHNCRIGRCCIICGGSALAGSVELGDGVMVAGQAGIADQIKVGAGGQVGAQSGVFRDVQAGERVLGTPSLPAKDTLRLWGLTQRLPDVIRDFMTRERSGTTAKR